MLLNGDGPLGSEAAFLQPHDSSHYFVLRGLIVRAEDTQNEETEPHTFLLFRMGSHLKLPGAPTEGSAIPQMNLMASLKNRSPEGKSLKRNLF